MIKYLQKTSDSYELTWAKRKSIWKSHELATNTIYLPPTFAIQIICEIEKSDSVKQTVVNLPLWFVIILIFFSHCSLCLCLPQYFLFIFHSFFCFFVDFDTRFFSILTALTIIFSKCHWYYGLFITNRMSARISNPKLIT